MALTFGISPGHGPAAADGRKRPRGKLTETFGRYLEGEGALEQALRFKQA
jgi:hypothetical protein